MNALTCYDNNKLIIMVTYIVLSNLHLSSGHILGHTKDLLLAPSVESTIKPVTLKRRRKTTGAILGVTDRQNVMGMTDRIFQIFDGRDQTNKKIIMEKRMWA